MFNNMAKKGLWKFTMICL